MKTRKVYLPSGTSWASLQVKEDSEELGERYEGGRTLEVELSIEDMPVFVKVT